MSFRRDVAARLEFDMELNRNVAQGYEVDIGLQVRRQGWKIIFDPQLAIRHYSAPRATVGLRTLRRGEHPVVRVQPAARWPASSVAAAQVVSLVYQFAVGERPAPGFLPLVLSPIARRFGFETHHARAALKGAAARCA